MKLRKILAGAMALVMVASSLLVAPVETKAAPQTIDNLDCTGWWTAHTAGVEIYDGGTYTINLTTQYKEEWDVDSYDGETNLGIVQENWEAPIFVLYSGDEAKVGGAGYSEHYVGRADIWGWAGNSGATGSQTGTANCDWTNGWTTYTDAMKAGTACKYVVTRDGSEVKVICTLANVETEYTITLPAAVADDVAVYFSLSGQCCTLTDISWTAPASIEITHKIAGTSVGVTTNMEGRIYAVPNTTDDIPDVITWTSSDESVATVDAEGKVTTLAPGMVTITATCGQYTDTCTFEVVAAENPITAIEVTADKTEIKIGATAQLTTTITAEDPDVAITDDTTVTYTSSDAKIATVDANGVVTAVKPGIVTITATVGSFTDTVEITVPVVPVTSIDLKVDKTDLDKGDIVNVVATVNPADTTEDTTITWTSSNEKVAKVDANGTVTAVGGGNATITATIGEVSASVKFKVTAQETVVKKTEIADLTVGAFLSAQTDGVELKKGHTYTFKFTTTRTNPDSTAFYDTASYFIYTNSENKFNTADYKEVIFARGDVWCWFNADTAQNPDNLPEGATFTRTYPADWNAWIDAQEAGAASEIIVKYDGKTVTVTYTVGDANTVASFPVTIPSGSKLYLGLTGENVALTDIEVADEYVKTITGTGDFNMVLPLVLVIFGGAVVFVASKKRFA